MKIGIFLLPVGYDGNMQAHTSARINFNKASSL